MYMYWIPAAGLVSADMCVYVPPRYATYPVDQLDAGINWLSRHSKLQCIMPGCTTEWPSSCATLCADVGVKKV